MYFSRVSIDAKSADPEDLVALLKGDVYNVHQIIWRLFPEDQEAKRDFLFRREVANGWPFFYLVSERKPQPLSGLVRVESKTYQPKLHNGQQLAFSLRINPVITKKAADGKKRYRHDIVMNAKHSLKASSISQMDCSAGELQHTVGIKWLGERAEKLGFGFDPENVRIYGYQQHRFTSKKQKDKIQFSVLDYNGLLMVTESDRFYRTLMKGIGRAKAFGCGLMLVRRV
ncbi:CasE: CRISPR system CASCADE complex protein CasE/Cas6 [Desulfosarcina variabilis str. Montpellier]|uniref:type I-E CRISPR-associated protein Cas6/Cse3/CasE n=1 Tax=Desulfosarcina variabilis TaxID=2300 RepID=UPI003AFB7A7A